MDNSKKNKRKSNTSLEAPRKLKILVSIVDRKRVDYFLMLLESFQVNLQNVIYARGTAPSNIAEYMGLKDNSKAVILSVVQEDKLKDILTKYEDEVFKSKANQGIAFTIPIKSLIGVYIYQFLANIEV